MVVSNTDSDVVFEIASQNYYVLLSGRWYRSKDLDNAEVALSEAAELKNTPPKIIIKYTPAVLILIDGVPKLEEIENSTLERVINTPYVILKYKSTYYLASDTMWFEAWSITGPWTEARSLPKDVQQVDDQLKKQQQEQGVSAPEDQSDDDRVPEMVVSIEPAELIFIDGKPEFTPLGESEIMVVSNTDSDVVFEIASQNYYVLLSGRWYRSKDLDNATGCHQSFPRFRPNPTSAICAHPLPAPKRRARHCSNSRCRRPPPSRKRPARPSPSSTTARRSSSRLTAPV
jgi:hypothetical protein